MREPSQAKAMVSKNIEEHGSTRESFDSDTVWVGHDMQNLCPAEINKSHHTHMLCVQSAGYRRLFAVGDVDTISSPVVEASAFDQQLDALLMEAALLGHTDEQIFGRNGR